MGAPIGLAGQIASTSTPHSLAGIPFEDSWKAQVIEEFGGEDRRVVHLVGDRLVEAPARPRI